MKLYINRKVLWGLIISIAIILGLGILSYSYFINLSAATQWTNHARRVIQNAEEVRSTMVVIENAQRGFSLTGDESYVRSFTKNVSDLDVAVNELDSLTKDNETQQSRVSELRPLITNQLDFTRSVIDSRKVSFDSAINSIRTRAGLNNMSKIQQTLTDIKQEEQGLILNRSLGVQKGFYQFVTAFLGLIFVTLLVLLGLVWLINANTRSRTVAEEKLREAELETKKINADLESFSYSVSHDLRAPLRSINGYAQILIEDYSEKFDAEGNRLLNVIINNAKRMGQLIDDLLEFSRLGRKEIQRSSINMDDQVRTIASELIEREGDRKIELTIKPLGSALADPNMMRQVWINLVGNAVKYSRNKEVAVIEVGRTEENGEVVFFIKDNGAGFDMAYTDKLFGVFQRLHKANEFEGTGVGLALVKRIVERHKGRIWAEAKVGQGATFYFSLPLV
ncbi:MAG TPA: CHASE3 domain-containing protein [Cyclobacteriaceae bacterium]|nr:CHASE3 domain-containing protein [Cyclobacteriaceae bacterium]